MGKILIADSGGSTIDWGIIRTNGQRASFQTSGFNPYNQPLSALGKLIEQDVLTHTAHDVEQIFFYGAGITSETHRQKVEATLQSFFAQSTIHVHSDLLGAARALCGHTPGTVCILGTGSNCGTYDGTKVYKETPSLGWILNDEGSGSDLGKRLIKDYLNKNMPPEIASLFHEQYPWHQDKFLQHIYKGEKPAAFLGLLSLFVAQHIKTPYCRQLVIDSFEDFYKNNILPHRNGVASKVHFTGSIAFYYHELLKHVAKHFDIAIGQIIRSPIEKLILYHLKTPTQKK